MRTITVGTAGHIDHGKTALVRALTGQDTDRLPEEKRRGITIDLGFAHLDLDEQTRLAIVDVPGHEAFIRNMAAGASGIDLGLLVIAADEGVRPQTREHVAILELLAVTPAAIALTKVDRVDDDWLELAEDEVRETLATTAFRSAPLLRVSAQTGQGLRELKESLAEAARAVAHRDTNDFFRMPIDRVFSVRGTGTVATGTVWSGTLTRDQNVRLLPSGLSARVRGLERQGQTSPEVRAGERAAVALAGLAAGLVSRGETLVAETNWTAARQATARIRVLSDAARPLRNRQRVHLHLGTAVVTARLRLLEGELEPGADGFALLQLEHPIAARAGDRFILRSYSPVSTIAGGQLLEWSDMPYRRRARDVPNLENLSAGAPQEQDQAVLRLAGWRGVDEHLLRLHTVHRSNTQPQAVRASGRLYHAELERVIARQMLARLDELHELHPLRTGIEMETIRQAGPPGAPIALRTQVLSDLIQGGEVRQSASGVSRPAWVPRLTDKDAAVLAAVADRFEQSGLAPLAGADFEPVFGPTGRDALQLLLEQEQLIQIGHDLYMSTAAVSRARQLVTETMGRGPHSPADFRVALGLSRKHLIPLLEYFDRTGLTRRSGDQRTLESVQAVSDLGGTTP